MLARLVKKGALAYDQIGNSYLYRAEYSRRELTREATGSFIQRVFDGAMSPFLAHFVEQASKEEIRALRAELDRLEKKR
jgi:BlaI family penicillinase repressor